MKFKKRVYLFLVGMAIFFISLTSFHIAQNGDWTQDLDDGSDEDINTKLSFNGKADTGHVFRNLHMASGENANDLPVLLSKILESQVFKDYNLKNEESRQVMDMLVHNKNLSNAWISIGHVLENLQDKKNSLTRETLPNNSLDVLNKNKTEQNMLILDPAMVKDLFIVLHEIGYTSERYKGKQAEPLKHYKYMRPSTKSPAFIKFHGRMSQIALYRENDQVVNQLLKDLATLPFTMMEQHQGGTQLKLTYSLKDRGKALFKPMRFPREQGTLPNHFYFSDYERHFAEIAAFHLDRVLNFRRVPPVAGRTINITSDIWKWADKKFEKTFFISPAGNVCFHGHCDYYCDSGHAICGSPELLEGSFAVFLPPENTAPMTKWRHPWRRSYSKRKKAEWETDYKYCETVIQKAPFNKGRRLLDLMDMAVFDFLQGNLDRHHYSTFQEFDNESAPILFDNGRGFGKAHHDEMSILAPIYQCCKFRASTLETLLKLYSGPETLGDVMRKSLSEDKLNPILIEDHLVALDRRVATILLVVHDCLSSQEDDSSPNVVIDDGF